MVRIPREADANGAEVLVTVDLAPIHVNRSCSQTFIHKLHVNGIPIAWESLDIEDWSPWHAASCQQSYGLQGTDARYEERA